MTPADTLVPSVPEQSPALAGTVRLRRSTPLAAAIIFAVVVIAAAGVASGLKKATGGFPRGYVPRAAHTTTQAVSATPYAPETVAPAFTPTVPAAAASAPTAQPRAEAAPAAEPSSDAKADAHPAAPPRVAKVVKSEEDPEIDDAPPPQRDARPMDEPQPQPDFDRGPPRPDNGPRQGYDDRGPYQPMPR